MSLILSINICTHIPLDRLIKAFEREALLIASIDAPCREECLLAMENLQMRTESICCWLESVDSTHKIYIDVNISKELGRGTWATVYDVHLHDQVELQYELCIIFAVKV